MDFVSCYNLFCISSIGYPEKNRHGKCCAAQTTNCPKVVDYLYDHFDEFKLLFTSGENNAYQEFIHRVVELDTGCTAQYIEASGNDAISSGRLTPELNHLLSSAFYTGMFEVVIHNMPKEQAMKHIQKMRRFYTAGWQTIFSGDGVRIVERVDRPKRLDSLPYLRQQDPH